jgi:amino acid adenylation domain-containing protein/non-ribosomal peptide synthase protein (TIGR01720 family)
LGHFQTLLAGLVANPRQRLSDLPLLTAAERHQLLVEWNKTNVDYLHDGCLHELFEAQVERTPEAIAVVPPLLPLMEQREGGITYRELNRRANQLAHHLRALGVRPETLVGICMERSLEMMVGLLGLLKAGGAYLPLDPTYPEERLAFMLSDAQASVLLTQEKLKFKIPRTFLGASASSQDSVQGDGQNSRPSGQPTILCLDTDWPLISQSSTDNPTPGTLADNLAYVVYTSGSTGKPKGTMISHRGLMNYLRWCLKAYAVADGQGAPVHSSLGFDLTITGLFAPLLVGRTVTLLPEDEGAETLAIALQQGQDFSLVKLTPAHLELLNRQLQPGEAAGRTRSFIIGGEALRGEILSFWQRHAPATRLINEYGPTETVVGCCVYEVPDESSMAGAVPIGRPIANTQLYVLDRRLQPTPIGVPGELYIGGDGLARGYLNRPDLTAEKFIPNPFRTTADGRLPTAAAESSTFSGLPSVVGSRLYKTGDLARYLPDGNIEFLGRIDHQVKIRGYRVELGEIEVALSHHPAMRDTVVLARSNKYGPSQKQLVAYLVADPERRPTVGELRSFLKQTLPDYMIPSSFVFVEALPLTPNGKVDRQALPVPGQARPNLEEKTLVAPQTHAEQVLTEIWSQILQIERIGVHDNFFELGGDSILSIQIIARANQAGLRLTPRQFFQHQTIAELAAVAEIAVVTSIEQGLVTGPVPLTPIQHWFFEQNLPEPQHWNQAMLLEAKQPLNPALLEQAVRYLLAHHDALRLRFYPTLSPPPNRGEKEGEGWQQINAALIESTPFSHIDLSAHSPVEARAAIEATAAKLQASLNLAEGPLIQVALFDLGSVQPNRLLIVIHHLAVDGVSWRILLEDLQTAYRQLEQGETVHLPAKTTSYKQWAELLAEAIKTRASEASGQTELAYWLAEPSLPIPPLPLDYPEGRQANTEASARTVTVSLNAEETRALLQEVPAAYRTQINDVLLTALGQAFAGWTGASALLFDLEGHGREEIVAEVDLSRTIGWFTTIFPVCLDLRAAPQPGEALKSMKEQLRRIPEHGMGYGLWRYLSEDSAIVSQLRARPQAEMSFNYLGQFDQVLAESALFRLARESSGPDHSLQGRRRYILEVEGSIMAGRLQVVWVYSENLHRRSTIKRLAEDFIGALRTLISHCQSSQAGGYTPSDFPEANLSQAELDDLLAELGAMAE